MNYRDPSDPGNSPKYHTGKKCIECGAPAGTAWSPLWCFVHNVKRMDRIDKSLNDILSGLVREKAWEESHE